MVVARLFLVRFYSWLLASLPMRTCRAKCAHLMLTAKAMRFNATVALFTVEASYCGSSAIGDAGCSGVQPSREISL